MSCKRATFISSWTGIDPSAAFPESSHSRVHTPTPIFRIITYPDSPCIISRSITPVKIQHPPSPPAGPNTFNENETIAKYEIMDGAPVRGESIPIRVFLAGYDLTPTMRDINKKFSVRYYLNLVLVDEEDRRYFKQQVCARSLYV